MTRRKTIGVTTNQQIDDALAPARRLAASDRRVVRAGYERKLDLLTLYLDDGVRVSIPRMSLQGLQDVTSLCRGSCHGLFAKNVFSGLKRRDGLFGVKGGGGADVHKLHPGSPGFCPV